MENGKKEVDFKAKFESESRKSFKFCKTSKKKKKTLNVEILEILPNAFKILVYLIFHLKIIKNKR